MAGGIVPLPPGMAKQLAKEAREGKASLQPRHDGYAIFYRNRQEIAVFGWKDEADTPTGYVKKLNSREWDEALARSKEP